MNEAYANYAPAPDLTSATKLPNGENPNSQFSFLYPDGCTIVPYNVMVFKVGEEERSRKDFGDLDELRNDIVKYGLLHPPLCTRCPETGKPILVAGERRTRAMQLTNPPGIPVLFRESMSPAEIAERELIENFSRKRMTWQEQCLNIDKAHRLHRHEKNRLGETWFHKETGDLFGYSRAHVSNSLILAEALRKGDEEVTNAESAADALRVLARRREREAIAARQARLQIATGIPIAATKSGGMPFMLDLDLSSGGGDLALVTPAAACIVEGGETQFVTNQDIVVAPMSDSPPMEVDFGSMFFLGDCVKIMNSWQPQTIPCIVTDPPYKIDMKNLKGYNNLDLTVNEHDVEENHELLPSFLEASYRVLVNNSFCVFWCDLEHWDWLRSHAERVGFTVQRWPIVWCKTHPCKNGAPMTNWTKATEVAMVCRKGTPKLQRPANKNYILADAQAERALYNHPFAKPKDVWDFILGYVTYPGATVLDPFAGQFSCARAAVNLGIKPLCIEKIPYHFVRGVDNMAKLWMEMTMSRCVIQNDPRNLVTPEMIVEPTDSTDE